MRKSLFAVVAAAITAVAVKSCGCLPERQRCRATAPHQGGGQDSLVRRMSPIRPRVLPGLEGVGSDIDIGAEVAKRMGMKAVFQKHELRRDHPRPAREEVRRGHQRHERHPERRKQVNFVDYMKVVRR